MIERCIGCQQATMTEPALYQPIAGAAIKCTLCAVCRQRVTCGDRALLEVIEFRLLLAAECSA